MQKLILLLKFCTRTSEITQFHAHMVKNGLDIQPFSLSKLLASSILDMDHASSIFNQIENPNLFMFNTMLRGCSISEKPNQAFPLFNTLRSRGIVMDQFSFICVLKSCARSAAVSMGSCVHGLVIQSGFVWYINVRNTLLHFYCMCRRIEDAHQLFDEIPQKRDLVSWNSLIGGYLQISQPGEVVRLFGEMHACGCEVGVVTVLSALSAFGDLGDLFGGETLHGHCIKRGLCDEFNVVTAIIGMYAKNGCVDFARKIFDGISKKDVVTWNCMIEGYTKNGLVDEALHLFEEMKFEEVKPDRTTLAGLLSGCASSGALAAGIYIHKYIEEESFDLDVVLATALLDMYSKCGLIGKAVDVFDKIQNKDVKLWTTMIACYGLHGKGMDAIQLFDKMEAEGVMPNEVTFLAALSACSHNGLVTGGKICLERMVRVYGFSPCVEHYGCMIDLLGRAGLLEEAYELIMGLPIEVDGMTWRALLAACRVHGNIELGGIVKKKLSDLNYEHPTDSILLSASYASLGRWDDVARMREPMEVKLMNKKEVGLSSVAIDG